jgi:hypothetical protein
VAKQRTDEQARHEAVTEVVLPPAERHQARTDRSAEITGNVTRAS